MKKLFTAWLLLCAFTMSHAFAQQPTLNVEGAAASIVSKLDKQLTLDEKQKPKILTIVTNYLQQRINIGPLQQSNEKAFKSKLNSMQNGLRAKLKPVLNNEQLEQFEKMKPATADNSNVLSHLFY